MLTDFHRGFATYLASFSRSNFHQHRCEPTQKTREFDEKLRQYLEVKPVDIKIGKVLFFMFLYLTFITLSDRAMGRKDK